MNKYYLWYYQLRDRVEESKYYNIFTGYIVLPTECGITAAAKIMSKYDETYLLTQLNCLGKVDVDEVR